MSRRKKKSRANRQGEPEAQASPFQPDASSSKEMNPDMPRRWLLAGTMILFVARPLFPSESVGESGDGIMLVMLSLVLLAGWGVWLLYHREGVFRWGATDAAVLVLLTLYSASGIWATQTGNAREAINVVWAWIGMGAGFFLVRQLVHTEKEVRAIAAVMIGLAVALSAYGLYQSFYDLPKLRAEYDRNPDRTLLESGLWWEPGSSARTQFEQRLNSSEPFATFALTNSLAGYLAPWLVIAVGLAVVGRKPKASNTNKPDDAEVAEAAKRTGWRFTTWAALAMVGIIVTACVLLTKSRSAYAATLLGLGLVGLLRFSRDRTIGWRLPAAVLGIIVVLVTGAIAVGGIDREVVSEAGKSLGYRLQYWQSTFAMIEDRPVLGCGPGQFQNHYEAYKLPEASEEIADPHNFLLEVWATGGTGALLALLAVLACFAWAVWRQSGGNSDEQHVEGEASRWILGGALVGFLIAWPLGGMVTAIPSRALLVLGLPLAVLTVAWLLEWIETGRLPVTLLVIGLVVLLVNLLAAGGIGFPGVAGTFWLILALGLPRTESGPKRRTQQVVAWSVTLVGCFLAVACYWTAYKPVLDARGHWLAALSEPRSAAQELAKAAEADPLWAKPWKALTMMAMADWRKTLSPDSLAQFERAARMAGRRDPESSIFWNVLGNQYFEVYERIHSKYHLESAVDAYRRAIELYPNKAEYHGRLALALEQTGNRSGAQKEARKAIELDDIMPHQDKKLEKFAPKLREELIRIGS
jgi:O-antigen ligase